MSFNDDFEFGDGVVEEPPIKENQSFEVPKQVKQPQPAKRGTGLPDPNTPVQRPNNVRRNYNVNTSVGKQQGQRQQRPSNMQIVTGKQHQQIHRQLNSNVNKQSVVNQNTQQPQQPVNQTKKKSKLPMILIGIIILLVIIIVVFAIKSLKKPELIAQTYDYETSGKYAYDKLCNALINYDATTIDSVVGTEDGDSYIAQEWAYINGVKLRQEFVTKVCALVSFKYPSVQQMSTTGVDMTDDLGNPIMIESYMNNGEDLIVTVPDYSKIILTMDEDIEYIKKLFKSSGYSEEDYRWNDEMANLMIQYICDKSSIPVREVSLNLPIGVDLNGQPYIADDSELDKLLFSTSDFRDMCTKFSQICLGWTGYKDEPYVVQEEQKNPEYDEWYKLFIQYYEADGGKYNKRTSKWEPWYLRDENNNYVLDENGEKIVNYYSIKADDGTDWIQPAETILVDVTKYRQVEDPWIEETGVMFNWIGQYYIQNEYNGVGNTVVRVGDGSKDYPAGIGTSIITKVLCDDGKYHDVEVSMLGYWIGEDAINYAEKFSTKNRGFTTTSVIQLITYEIEVKNLEDVPITFLSEMTLTDSNSNVSSRTGTMYGFVDSATLKPDESVIINDWATSTELEQKYVCWGKSFGRTYSMVYFDCLAGTGNIPTYSAYEQFTGKSSLE